MENVWATESAVVVTTSKNINYKTAFPNGASVNLGQGKRNDSIAFSSDSAKQRDRKENY